MRSLRNEHGARRRKRAYLPILMLLLVQVNGQSAAPSVVLSNKARKKPKGGEEPEPTFHPTESPSMTPEPTVHPSEQPSVVPSTTEPPRIEPTRFPVVTLRATNVELTIGGVVLPLSDASRNEMERIISDGIAFTIVKVLGSDQIENLDILVELVSPEERKLQSNSNATIVFDALIEIQSVLEEHDVDRYTIGAFNDPIEQVLFLEALKATDDPVFENVTFVSTSNYIEEATPLPQGGRTKNSRAAVAISVLVAIAAVVGAVFAFLFYHRQRRKARVENETSSKQLEKLENGSIPSDRALNLETESSSDIIDEKEVPSEIVVDTSSDDDVSSKDKDSVDSTPPVALDLPACYSVRSNLLPRDPLDTSTRSTAPSDEAKSTADHMIDTVSLLSADSIEYDFEEIFRTDGSLVSRPSVAFRRKESSSTNDSDKLMYGYEREDYTLPSVHMDDTSKDDNDVTVQDEYESGKWRLFEGKDDVSLRGSIEKNKSGETKLLDEDDNTVDDEYDEYEGARLLFQVEDPSESIEISHVTKVLDKDNKIVGYVS